MMYHKSNAAAFVPGGFVPAVSAAASAFAGASHATTCVSRPQGRAAAAATPTRMQSESMPSMPFLKRPKALDGSLPAGEACFDPLGFTEALPLVWLREAEIKHCRIAMLATLGFIAQEFGTLDFYHAKSKLAVEQHDQFVQGPLQQVLLFTCFWEVVAGVPAMLESLNGKRLPGYFGFDPLNLGKDEASFKRFQANEIRNGRLAMIAIGGFIHQEWLTKQGVMEQLMHFKPLY